MTNYIHYDSIIYNYLSSVNDLQLKYSETTKINVEQFHNKKMENDDWYISDELTCFGASLKLMHLFVSLRYTTKTNKLVCFGTSLGPMNLFQSLGFTTKTDKLVCFGTSLEPMQ